MNMNEIDLVCPFCNENIFYPLDSEGDYYVCKCQDEKYGTIELWQALIKIKKELDIRKKQVEIANKAFDFISTEWDNVDCSRKELGACAFNAKEDIAGWESDIETEEQKDAK